MEYKIVVAHHGWTFGGKVESLTKTVNDLIQLGWEPIGGINSTDSILCQAMIKRR